MKPAAFAALSALALMPVPVSSVAQPPVVEKLMPYYVGYTGKRWRHDFGIVQGRCNVAAAAAARRGAVAVLDGGVGKLVASKLGRPIARGDLACMGHALELAGEGRSVAWTDRASGVSYRLTPTRSYPDRNGAPCRTFVALLSADGKRAKVKGVACRREDGDWEYRGT